MKLVREGYRFLAILGVVTLVGVTRPSASAGATIDDPAEATASRIFQATGVQGGLVLHVNCGDGKLTAALRTNQRFLVHGLVADPAKVEDARRNIRSLGFYGPVSIDEFDGRHLPYVDNLAKLVIISGPSSVAREEVLRVLCPGGVAVTLNDELAISDPMHKAWPGDIDEWTHWLHDAGKSGVARDIRVGPPRRMQWVAEPLWTRGHEVITSVGAVVTARGRIFTAIDEGQTAIYSLPSQWMLVARDAFSGLLLWKQPMPYWSAPVTLGGFTRGFQPQRLVTDGQCVYLPTGEQAVLTALDAATGATLRTLDSARGTREILCDDGLLVAVTRPVAKGTGGGRGQTVRPSLVAAQADTFEVLWTATVAPSAIALSAGRVFYWADGQVVALDAQTAAEVWQTPFSAPAGKGRRSPSPTLRVCEGAVYVECAARLAALSATDGEPRWERKKRSGIEGGVICRQRTALASAGQHGFRPRSGHGRSPQDHRRLRRVHRGAPSSMLPEQGNRTLCDRQQSRRGVCELRIRRTRAERLATWQLWARDRARQRTALRPARSVLLLSRHEDHRLQRAGTETH